jgi:hypothetical protein
MAETMRATVEKALGDVTRTTTFGRKLLSLGNNGPYVLIGTPEETTEILTYLLAVSDSLGTLATFLADRLDAIEGAEGRAPSK